MSFLNSVLSSINDGKGEISKPTVVAAPKRDAPAPQVRDHTTGAKRKASNELSKPLGKLSKNGDGKTTVPSKSKPFSNDPSPSRNPTAHKSTPAERIKPQAESKAAPKKGSLKEIMARAKQNSTMQVGQLTHKPKEKISIKKELAYQREIAKKGKKGTNSQSTSRALPSNNGVPMAGGPSKDKRFAGKDAAALPQKSVNKSRPQPTYQGTAKPRPPQPAYRGTMNPKDAPTKRGYDSELDKGHSKAAQNRPGGYTDYDSEDEYESDDGYDYASDDYSDMDAGFDDVDEEEALAEREARKDDAREQRKLDELARQKEERKRRVQNAAERERPRGR